MDRAPQTMPVNGGGGRYRVGDCVVDTTQRQVSRDGEQLHLNWRAFEALRLLVEAGGKVVTREELFGRLWPDIAVDESSLAKCISQLRKTLSNGRPGDEYLETIPRVGYRIAVPVHTAISETAASVSVEPRNRRGLWWYAGFGLSAATVVILSVALGWSWRQKRLRIEESRAAHQLGQELFAKNDSESAAAAVRSFQRAVELDPNFAQGYASLAQAIHRASPLVDGKQPRTALEAAERGVAVDPKCLGCQISLGFFLFYYDWQWKRAEEHLRLAVKMAPASPDAQTNLAMMLAATGRHDEALEWIDRAVVATPYRAGRHAIRASILYFQRRYQEAVAAADRAISLDAGSVAAWDWRTKALFQSGHGQAAVEAMVNSVFVKRGPEYSSVSWKDGFESGIQRLLMLTDRFRSGQGWRRASWRAMIGDFDGALSELEHSYQIRNVNMVWTGVDPIYDPIRNNQRFRAIVNGIGAVAIR